MLPSDPEMCGHSVRGDSQIQLWLEKSIGTMVWAGRRVKEKKKENETNQPNK